MLFNSSIFVLLFLPLTLAGYFLCNRIDRRWAGIWLLIMSLWFYGYNNPRYLLLIGGSVCANYLLCLLLRGKGSPKRRKLLLFLGVAFNVALIFAFKYLDFFLENVNALAGTDYPLQHIALPLGISFFTFQQISYVVDSYRDPALDYGFLDYANFVTFFPQLVAGPIVLHSELIPQLRNDDNRRPHYDRIARGVMLFALGLSKKMFLADKFGAAVDWGFSHTTAASAADVLLVMLAYTFQIYFDFSGYSDMAVGLASLFGFDLPMNFNSPYKALSITDFWRRWHMTLSRFLRTYVYFPLGGSSRGKGRTYWNILVVFWVSGLWHGANWTFVLWGFVHGLLQVGERALGGTLDRLAKPLRWLGTFFAVNVLWLLFRAESVGQWAGLLRTLFLGGNWRVSPDLLAAFRVRGMRYACALLHLPLSDIAVYIIGAVGLFAAAFYICLTLRNNYVREYPATKGNLILTLGLLLMAVLSMGRVSVFLYFNF